MSENLIFELEEGLCETIQYLFYVTKSYEDIIKDILSNKRGTNANKELLDYYNEQYINHNLKLKLLQEEILNGLYEVPRGYRAVFYVDFMRKELVVTSIEKNIITVEN